MTRPDHTAVPPAGVIAAAGPVAWMCKTGHGTGWRETAPDDDIAWAWTPLYRHPAGAAQAEDHACADCGSKRPLHDLDCPVAIKARAEGAAPTAAQAAPAAWISEARERAALQFIHDTFKRDLDQGYRTKDKEFAVAISAEALANTATPKPKSATSAPESATSGASGAAKSELASAGWREAAKAWTVCASVHLAFGKGRDALFKTRQADYLRHAKDAAARAKPE